MYRKIQTCLAIIFNLTFKTHTQKKPKDNNAQTSKNNRHRIKSHEWIFKSAVHPKTLSHLIMERTISYPGVVTTWTFGPCGFIIICRRRFCFSSYVFFNWVGWVNFCSPSAGQSLGVFFYTRQVIFFNKVPCPRPLDLKWCALYTRGGGGTQDFCW